jgi:GT2 family glycosyltransferase
MSQPGVEVVVVAYNAPASLARCLAGLQRQFAVTVVDNSSSTEVAAVARDGGARYIDAGANRGFAVAVNIALESLAGEQSDVLLLNPDALIEPEAVALMSAFLHAAGRDRVGAVAPLLRGEDGREQQVAWPFPTPLRMCAEAIGLGRLPARRRFVIGAALLLRSAALEDVGRFDERFFLYAEETDWQRRAAARGWRSAVCPEALARHEGAGSSADERRREALFHAAQETYIRKWYGRGGWLVYRLAAGAGAGARALLLTSERRAEASRRLRLYRRGPRRSAAMEQD